MGLVAVPETTGAITFRSKTDQPLPRRLAAGAVRRMADRAREPVADVPRMLREAGIADDVAQIMAFGTNGILTLCTDVRREKQIRDQLPWSRRLAELVSAFQN